MPPLATRDDDGYSYSYSDPARYAFLAIFIVLIIVVLFGTLRVNKKRAQRGMQPIYGTRWITPPSYRQSQNQYHQPTRPDLDVPGNYVPTYTTEAGEYDMGYYDNQGKFHANPNAKAPIPEVHVRQTSMSNAAPISNLDSVDDEDDLYRRPPAGPNRPGAPSSGVGGDSPSDGTANGASTSGPGANPVASSSADSIAPPPGPPPERS
ncbi:hypothetical protein DICA3_E15830 [Diutina catenulata]